MKLDWNAPLDDGKDVPRKVGKAWEVEVDLKFGELWGGGVVRCLVEGCWRR